MHDFDIDYYRERIEDELSAASRSADDAIRTIHLSLAHAYAELISSAVSGADLIRILPTTDKLGPGSTGAVTITQHLENRI